MKGITVSQSALGWTIIRAHYSASIRKDPSTPQGAEWYRNAHKGVSDRDWRKEHEIDFSALGGQLWFPEYDEKIHLVPAGNLEHTKDPWTLYNGCDPHSRRPHALVWLVINRAGQMKVVWSHYAEEANAKREASHKGRLNISDYAKIIRGIEKRIGQPAWERVMDVAGVAMDAEEDVNYFQRYADLDLVFREGKKNRQWQSYSLLAKALEPKRWLGEDGPMAPTLTILEGNGDNNRLARQIQQCRYREHRSVMPDRNAPEEPQEKERDLIDALGYILMFEPYFVDQAAKLTPFDMSPYVPR